MTYSRFNIEVQPLSIGNHELNTKRMLELMAVNPEDTSVPLYIHVVYRILRDMRLAQQATGAKFQYYDFKDNLAKSGLTPQQLAPLHQRLSVLESFLSSSPAPRSKKGKKHSHVDNATTWTNEVSLIVRSSSPSKGLTASSLGSSRLSTSPALASRLKLLAHSLMFVSVYFSRKTFCVEEL